MSFPVGFPARRPERWLMPILAFVMLALSYVHSPVVYAANFNPGCTNGVGKAAQLQNAVATANTNGAADTITLMSGCTYTLTETLTVTADGGSTLTINGNGATLSGDKKVRVIYVDDGANLNLNTVKVRDGISHSFMVAGGGIYLYNSTMTLINSTVFHNATAQDGGGIYNGGGTLTLTNSTVSDNIAKGGGGGIYNSGGTMTLTNSTVSGNTAIFAGGISNNGTMTLMDSTVSDNAALTDGGGGMTNGGTLTMTNSTVSGNTSLDKGGGIHNIGTATLTNSTVSGNIGFFTGGGIYNATYLTAALTLTDSTVSDNMANVGGGVYNYSGSVTLTNSTVSGNTASAAGGGIYNRADTMLLIDSRVSGNTSFHTGGAIHNDTGTMTLTDSRVSGNTAPFGGSIYNGIGAMTLTASTVTGNTASSEGGGIKNYTGTVTLIASTVADNTAVNLGGGFYNIHGTIMLTNSTVTGNTAANNGGGIHNRGTVTLTNSTLTGNSSNNSGGAVHNFGGTLNLNKSILANSSSGGNCVSEGNGSAINAAGANLIEADANNTCNVAGAITTDPKLGQRVGNPAYFPLLTGSPAIDAGGQGDCPQHDQRGAMRPQDGDGDGVRACDLGAFEKLATTGTQLLKNSSFESNSAGQPLLSPWTMKQASGDGIVCKEAYAGTCALMLDGGPNEKTVLTQNVKLNNITFNPRDQLRLSLMVKGAPSTQGTITLRVTYSDNMPVQKVTIPLGRTYGGYEERFAELYLTSGAVAQITFEVSHTSPKGKTYLDAVSLRHKEESLLGVPAAEMRQPAVTLP